MEKKTGYCSVEEELEDTFKVKHRTRDMKNQDPKVLNVISGQQLVGHN